MVERSTELNLKTLRTDNGGEYTSKDFETYLKMEGTHHAGNVVQNRVVTAMLRLLEGSA